MTRLKKSKRPVSSDRTRGQLRDWEISSEPDNGYRTQRICCLLTQLTQGASDSLLRPVLIPEPRLPRFHRNRDAIDINLLHARPYIERVAIRNYDVRNLAHIERAKFVAQSKSLRRIQRD